MTDLNLEWLASFVAFVEHESFTAAARVRHISQPALFVQVKKLGEHVGRPLYRREGRRIVITDDGRTIAAFGREVASASARVLAAVRGEGLRGPVVLAAGQGALSYLALDAVRRFPKQRFPLRILTLGSDAALDAVRSGRAHVGICVADEPPSGLVTKELRRVRQCVVMPSTHRLATRASVAVGDLRDESIIVAPSQTPHRAMVEALFRDAKVPCTIAVESPGWDLMLRLAAAGVGLAIVNDFCLAPPRCVRVPLRGAPQIRYFCARVPDFDPPAVLELWRLLVA